MNSSSFQTSPSTPPRILVVEDEAKTLLSIAEGMRMEGWQVTEAASGDAANRLIDQMNFDLFVLDWMLPEQDGLQILQHARSIGKKTPALMLTARESVNDRVAGLEGGVDDYLVKPFAFPELLARSRALLRRSAMHKGHVLEYDDLRLDSRARVATRGSQEIFLTPREVDILEYLLQNQGRMVTREMLQRDVWRQPNRYTAIDNVIDVQIMRLRKKIDDGKNRKLIQTIRGLGYRLGKEIN